MAGRNLFFANAASSSRCCSRSSRNFRNMIHVRSGRRSRSPLRPLSLRMMSRAALIRLPSACAVVFGVSAPLVFLRAIEHSLQVGYGLPELFGTAEQPDDFAWLAMLGNRRDMQNVRQHELRIAVLG